jgi:hypothetical protein
MILSISNARATIFLPASASADSSHDFGSVMPFESPTVVSFLIIGIFPQLTIMLENDYKFVLYIQTLNHKPCGEEKLKQQTAERILEKIPLGKTQMKVLEYLAKNPNSLKKHIADGLDKDIKGVNDAVEALRSKGLVVIGEKVRTTQNTCYDGYRLSSQGVAFLLAYSKDDKAVKRAAEDYEHVLTPDHKRLYSEIENELHDWQITRKILRLFGHTYLLYGRVTFDNSVKTALLSKGMFSSKEVKELSRVVPKFQALRDTLQSARKQIDDVLDGKF